MKNEIESGFFNRIAHEIVHIDQKDLPSEKRFGLLISAVLFVASLYSWLTVKYGWVLFFGLLGLTLVAISFLSSRLLSPLNRLWFRIGLVLSMFSGPIVLGIVFFLIITPVSLLTRALGRDPLNLQRSGEESYWVPRDDSGPNADSFERQF